MLWSKNPGEKITIFHHLSPYNDDFSSSTIIKCRFFIVPHDKLILFAAKTLVMQKDPGEYLHHRGLPR